MNTLLLQPTDVLFFRDGRPMDGSLVGHGAAWPLPTVTNAALHAALHRSKLPGHKHDHRHGRDTASTDARTFGSLLTVGPFPVRQGGRGVPPVWYFPRPLDLLTPSLAPTLLPAMGEWRELSSLPKPLHHAVASTSGPSKGPPEKGWLSSAAFGDYLSGSKAAPAEGEAVDDSDFSDSEANIGIGIDPLSGTQDGKRFYSAHYLRLREGWQVGLCAATSEKTGETGRVDLIPELIKEDGHVVVGGQQRFCTAQCAKEPTVPLPRGHNGFKTDADGKVRVKWVLLSPAIFPAIKANGTTHFGGWLPSWIRQTDGAVQLRADTTPRGGRENRETWRARVQMEPMIKATLVAAIIAKPLPISGWSLGDETLGEDGKGGAKSTHLAVPAGAVYYFEAEKNSGLGTTAEQEAQKLAAALNWHGTTQGTEIKNRRSTLLGEKGFGLGVCGPWQFHPGL
jgi:CRISPR-associated protein Cmr3